MSDLPTRLGRYSIVRRLGTGGMAEVFLARSRGAEGTDKLLVVKRILPVLASNAQFRSMFIDEARVALRLSHPNIVQVYAFESDGNTLMLVMEYVDGPDLAELSRAVRLRGETLPFPLCAWIIREIARGLHYAHERRGDDGALLDLVHRDVSPGNMLLSYEGQAKLGDFGIARASATHDEDSTLKGKFGYMSPEQARLERVDRRADIYSLGVVLGELLAGRSMQAVDRTPEQMLERLRQGETPDVHRLLSEAPVALRTLIARMTAPTPDARPSTAREVVDELTRYLRTQDREWDHHALEELLHRVVPRVRVNTESPLVEPVAKQAQRADAVTVVEAESRRTVSVRPSRPPPAMDPSSLTRERVHVVVLLGRIVPTHAKDTTLDLRPFFNVLEALAYKADAWLLRNEDGMGMRLIVGVVRPGSDYALRAAQLALDVQEAVATLTADGMQFSLAMGMARGVAALARAGSNETGFEIVDNALGLASALSHVAEGGETLAAPGVYRIVRRAFYMTECSAGRAPSVRARPWKLERIKSRLEREQDAALSTQMLFGRTSELAQMRTAMGNVREQRQGETVLVTGEMGIGKSALLAAFCSEYEADGAVIRATAGFGASEKPFGCIAQLLFAALGVDDEESSDRSQMEATLERAAEIALGSAQAGKRAARRALRVVAGLELDHADNEGATLREVVMIVRRLLVARALMNAIMVVVDDVDQADRLSRAVLIDLVRRPLRTAVLVVLSLREGDEIVREGADRRATTIVRLGPLAEDARRSVVASRLNASDVSDQLMREVLSAAGGNPLMLLEVIEALSDRGRIEVLTDEDGSRVVLNSPRDGDIPLPATLEEVLAGRMEALAPQARSVARWASLLVGDAPKDLLLAVAGEGAEQAIEQLLSSGLMTASRGQSDSLVFAHSALSRVARSGIDPTQLPGMHAHIAAAFERRGDSGTGNPTALAYHREAAGLVRPAARAWLTAALRMFESSKHAEALHAFGRALQLTQGVIDTEGLTLRFAAHMGREEIARMRNLTRVQRDEILAMRSVAVRIREPRLIARALSRQARYKLDHAISTGFERDVAAAVRVARGVGEARSEAEARRALAAFLGRMGRYVEALREINAALAVLETREAVLSPPWGSAEDGVAAARTVRVEVLLAKGALLRQTGAADNAIEVYAEAYALVTRYGPARLIGHILNNLGVACSTRGDYGDALRLMLASIVAQREHGQRDRLGMALSNAGQIYEMLGQTHRALDTIRKAIEVYNALGGTIDGRADAHVALAEIHLRLGQTESAQLEIERAHVEAARAGRRYDLVRIRTTESRAALARGDLRVARERAEDAEKLASEAGLVIYALHARAQLAEAAVSLGDRQVAQRAIEQVMADPLFVDPWKVERGDQLIATTERVLRALGDSVRADELAVIRRAHVVRTQAEAARAESAAPMVAS